MLAKHFTSKGNFKVKGTSAREMALLDRTERVLVTAPVFDGDRMMKDAPVLIVAEGAYDKAEFKKLMPVGTAVERFKGADLYLPPKSANDEELLMAHVGDRFALFGTRETLAMALEGGGGVRDQALLERATRMASQCEFWIVAVAPPSALAPSSAKGPKQMEDIESMDLGIALSKGLGVRLNMEMKTVESAQGMAMIAQLLGAMAAKESKNSGELASALRGMKVVTEGKTLKMALDVSEAQLQASLVKMETVAADAGRRTLESFLGMTSPSSQQAAVQTPAVQEGGVAMAAPPPAPPPPPQKRTIRILGLEEGEKEITYKTGQGRQ
jgi:hypothetical protein